MAYSGTRLSDEPWVCIDRRLPMHMMFDASERAIAEDPHNAAEGEVHIAPRVGMDPTSAEAFGALMTGKRWKTGRSLRVRHLNGAPEIHRQVEACAKLWLQHANLGFDFGPHAEAEIRISYGSDKQSWSYIGTDTLVVPNDEPTMHFGWLRADTDPVETRRVVLHEFGHALGLIHEHQHPMAEINWDKPAVYDFYVKKMNWTKQRVDTNLFAQHPAAETQFAAFDLTSIMHYPVPAELTVDRKSVGWNTDLSRTDREFIAQVYPYPAAPDSAMSAPPMAAAAALPAAITRRWG